MASVNCPNFKKCQFFIVASRCIYPFDKGTGLVRIKTNDAILKIREQIGDTEIVDSDPTDNFARDIRNKLAPLNKKAYLRKKSTN